MYLKVVKPLCDFVFALICCLFLVPITLVVGILIKLEDGGTVFYCARRLGKHGKPFSMLKFRSMKEHAFDLRNADGTTYSAADDPRLTKIGKLLRETSIDELPQFFNVLFFQMSVLGPRPDPVEWYEKSSLEVQKKYSLKPGISGYTQAYYRNTLSLEDKNRCEVYYAEHISFLLDVKVFFATLNRIFRRGDVYRPSAPSKATHIVEETQEASK